MEARKRGMTPRRNLPIVIYGERIRVQSRRYFRQSGVRAVRRAREKCRHSRLPLFTSVPHRSIESYGLLFLLFRWRVAAPNAFHPRGTDYIDRFMIAVLLQGLEEITRGGLYKTAPLIRFLDRPDVGISSSRSTSQKLLPGPIYRVPRKSWKRRGRIFLSTPASDFRASWRSRSCSTLDSAQSQFMSSAHRCWFIDYSE